MNILASILEIVRTKEPRAYQRMIILALDRMRRPRDRDILTVRVSTIVL